MLYVSPVEGRLVPRYGTKATLPPVFLGATRNAQTGAIRWTPEAVVVITDEEERLFRSEYEGHIRDGALVQRSPEDYKAWTAQQREAKEKARAAAEQARAEAEAAATPKDAPAEAPAALSPTKSPPS